MSVRSAVGRWLPRNGRNISLITAPETYGSATSADIGMKTRSTCLRQSWRTPTSPSGQKISPDEYGSVPVGTPRRRPWRTKACALSVMIARQQHHRRVVSDVRLGSISGETGHRGHAADHRNSNTLLRDESDEAAPRSEQLRTHIALLGNYHSQPMSNPLSVSFKCPNCKARGSFLPAPPEHQRRLLCEFTDKLGNWRPFY